MAMGEMKKFIIKSLIVLVVVDVAIGLIILFIKLLEYLLLMIKSF
jgi:hypothetical protein